MMKALCVFACLCLAVVATSKQGFAAGLNAEMTGYVQGLESQAKSQDKGFKAFDAERGKKIFFETHPNAKNGPISCSTCHTPDLKKSGKTLVGKTIDPLAPSANRNRLTNAKETEKWLTRNFKQVYGREGTAKEKGDVLKFIAAQ